MWMWIEGEGRWQNRVQHELNGSAASSRATSADLLACLVRGSVRESRRPGQVGEAPDGHSHSGTCPNLNIHTRSSKLQAPPCAARRPRPRRRRQATAASSAAPRDSQAPTPTRQVKIDTNVRGRLRAATRGKARCDIASCRSKRRAACSTAAAAPAKRCAARAISRRRGTAVAAAAVSAVRP
eukprot:365428-Chlamydomonas_euryale.AAC.27